MAFSIALSDEGVMSVFVHRCNEKYGKEGHCK